MRTVAPDVTGSPVISYEAIRLMERAYLYGTALRLRPVTVLTFLMLRRSARLLLALSPWSGRSCGRSASCTCSASFKLANVWGLPLIIGTAAEFGLNVTLRYPEGREHGGPLFPAEHGAGRAAQRPSPPSSGLRSIMVARHQGIFGWACSSPWAPWSGWPRRCIVLPVLLRLVERARLSSAANPAYVRKES